MKVPFMDLGSQNRPLHSELTACFERVVERSSFILGPEVERFERDFASYLKVGDCVAVNSGTAALQLVLQALAIGEGDEVITVPNTFIATAEAITAVGARPVFVDVTPTSYTMEPEHAEQAITGRTRAILPVHLYGQPADMDPLLEIARLHRLALVEDACQAHGAEYKGHKAGALGTAGCFSFYPSKNLGGCGEGGAIVTNDSELASRIRLLRNHGSVSKYEHSIAGYNFRMEALQAAFLAVKLKHLDQWNNRRRALAAQYTDSFRASEVMPPTEMAYARHVYHLYVIQADHRDALRHELMEKGIETGLHYPLPLHLQQAYQSLGYHRGDFPVCERLADRIMSLPMFPELSPRAVEHIVETIGASFVPVQTCSGQ